MFPAFISMSSLSNLSSNCSGGIILISLPCVDLLGDGSNIIGGVIENSGVNVFSRLSLKLNLVYTIENITLFKALVICCLLQESSFAL